MRVYIIYIILIDCLVLGSLIFFLWRHHANHSRQLKEAVKDLQKFKLAVEQASDHIIITDTDGIIIYANKAVQKITGFNRSEILGKKAGSAKLWGGQMSAEFYKKLWQTIKIKKQVFHGELRNRRKNGEEYIALSSISPVIDANGKVNYFVGLERDISVAKSIDRAKTEFVSLASHQLRTPLAAINWYSEMLLAGDVGKISLHQKNYLNEIKEANQRMTILVNTFLNISRIEMGTLAIEPQPCQLADLSREVVKELSAKILQKNIKLVENYDKLPLVNLDKKLVSIIFQNFLSNAIKYSPDNSIVEVSLVLEKRRVIFSVQDKGIGIPEDQKSKIFEKLFRASNVRLQDTDGTGLGLYLSKAIADNFGAKVWFQSKENQGSTFFVSLPLKGMTQKHNTKVAI